jgi:hypothetical protein
MPIVFGPITWVMMRRLVWIVAIALVAAACGGEAVAAPEPSPEATEITPQRRFEHPAPPPADARPRFPGFESVHEGVVALAAMAKGELEVFESPGDPDPFLVLPYENILGSTTVVGVIGAPADGWAEVSLAMRPNGSTGWIRTDEVDLFVVSGRIVVDLSDRSLSYYQDGVEVLTTQVAVGSSRSPTPTGLFYVTDSVTLTKAGTPWGPHALGLSARSDHITEFNGGDGIIGIHGTSRPSSIGEAASMGCIRLHNEMITRLHALVPLGTPVEIRA